MQGWIALGLTLWIAGCAAPVPTNRDDVASQIAVRYDEYTKAMGLALGLPDPDPHKNEGAYGRILGSDSASASFIGFVRDDGSKAMWLRVRYSGKNWIFFDRAIDIDGKHLPLLGSRRRIGGSSVIEETFDIQISRDYAEQHRAIGMNIRCNGQAGDLVVLVPAVYVDGFLQRFDAEKRSKLNQ